MDPTEFRQFLSRARRFAYWRYRYLVDEWLIDAKFGIDTAGIIESMPHRKDPRNKDLGFYQPVTWRSFVRLLSMLAIDDYRPFTFVDVGAGKGRAVIFAAEAGFTSILGLEISDRLVSVARQNVANYRRRRRNTARIQIICADAIGYPLPQQPLVYFLYNPFVGAAMERFTDQIVAHYSKHRLSTYILYRNPTCAQVLEEHQQIRTIAFEEGHRVYVVK